MKGHRLFERVFTYSFFFFFSSRRRHTRSLRDWSSDVCSSDLSHWLPASLASKLGCSTERQAGRCGCTLMMGIRPRRCGSDRKSTRLNSSHVEISYAVFCLKKKKKKNQEYTIPNNLPHAAHDMH